MRLSSALPLTLPATFGLGALTVQLLHAQSKPPAYEILEVSITNQEAYMKEFAPLAVKAIEAAGGKFLARGGKTVAIEGAPPLGRMIVTEFDNMDQAKAAFATPAYLDARKIGDKYATFRSYVVEGVAK